MLFGKFTNAVQKRVYYPAVVQSGNRFAYCGNNPVMFVDPWGLVVTAWDKAVCTEEELEKLEQATQVWQHAFETGNQEQMEYAHQVAEQIRNRHREECGKGEYGFDDGNTGAGGSMYSQDFWVDNTQFLPAPEDLLVENNPSDSFLDSIFGSKYSVSTIAKDEIVEDMGLFELSSGEKVEVTISEIGDSSKPISVYAKQDGNNPIVSSSAGIKVNIWDFSATLNFGLDDTRLSGSISINDTSYAFHGTVDIINGKVGLEVSAENTVDSTTFTVYENIKMDIKTIVELALIRYFGATIPVKLPA